MRKSSTGRWAKADFVKGHMGGNEIVLLDGSKIGKEKYVKVALSVLDPPSIRGDQAGILEKPQRGGDVKVRIVDRTTRDFITMCGGLTQVLWKALAETDIGKRYRIRRRLKQLALETGLGLVRISAKAIGGKTAAFTDMTSYVQDCYRLGVSPIEVAGVRAVKAGKFLVADVSEIRRTYPEADFRSMSPETKAALIKMQADFDRQHFFDIPNSDFALFDTYSNDPTHGRVLFPHDVTRGHVEPSCGTGAVAVALAMAEMGRLGDGMFSIRLDSGGPPALGGPETTYVNVVERERKIASAEFSHSLVEITATGKTWIRVQ